MNRFYLITLGVVIILIISGVGILLMRNSTPELDPEIAKASAEFKANQNFRSEPAKKLIPHLKIGMTTQKVEALLGKPNKKYDKDSLWHYTLGYSQFISVGFDPNGIAEKFGGAYAYLKNELDQSADANKPSGYYKLEPNSD